MKFLARAMSTVVLLLLPALAEAGAIEQLQAFLTSTRTLKAEFSQTVTTRTGRKPQLSSGMVSLSRPGKLRWEIVKPYPQLVVGDGEKIWIHDPELQQVTVRQAGKAIGSSPAALLAGSNTLEKNFNLAEAGQADGLSWVEATPKSGDTGFEKIRLGMSGGELKVMELQDSFGQMTEIRFARLDRNPVLPATQFKFTPPPGSDVVGE